MNAAVITLVGRLFGRNTSVVHDDEFRLLLTANTIGALSTVLVSPILNSFTDPLGVSAAEIGLLVTAVAAPSIFLISIFGVLADRMAYGRKPVLVAGLRVFGGGGAAIALTTDFWAVLALCGLQGVGFTGVTPIIIVSFATSTPPTRRRRHRKSGSASPAPPKRSSRSSRVRSSSSSGNISS